MASKFDEDLKAVYRYCSGKDYSIFKQGLFGTGQMEVSVSRDDLGVFDYLGIGMAFRFFGALLCAPGPSPLTILALVIGLVDMLLRNIFAAVATVVASPVVFGATMSA